MPSTLYHVPRTISSPIYQAILELGVPSSDVQVETLTFADLKSPQHLKRNPMGSSPTLTDPDAGIAIWESGAVLTFLLSQYDRTFKLHPNPATVSPAYYAKFLHLQQYILATVYPFLSSLFIHILKSEEDQDPQYIETSRQKWKNLLAPTLVSFLGDSDFFMGPSMSAIDLLVAKPLNNAKSMDLLTDFPSLFRLFERIQSRPTFSQAYDTDTTTTSHYSDCRSRVLVPCVRQGMVVKEQIK